MSPTKDASVVNENAKEETKQQADAVAGKDTKEEAKKEEEKEFHVATEVSPGDLEKKLNSFVARGAKKEDIQVVPTGPGFTLIVKGKMKAEEHPPETGLAGLGTDLDKMYGSETAKRLYAEGKIKDEGTNVVDNVKESPAKITPAHTGEEARKLQESGDAPAPQKADPSGFTHAVVR